MKAIKAVRNFFKEWFSEEGWVPCVIIIIFSVMVCTLCVYAGYLVYNELSIPSEQGTYVVEDDGEILVYTNDGRYRYWVDPVSGYVNLKERKSSVTTNMTEEEFFRSLEERGFSLCKRSEDKGLRKEGD